jgi:hypothetical protein
MQGKNWQSCAVVNPPVFTCCRRGATASSALRVKAQKPPPCRVLRAEAWCFVWRTGLRNEAGLHAAPEAAVAINCREGGARIASCCTSSTRLVSALQHVRDGNSCPASHGGSTIHGNLLLQRGAPTCKLQRINKGPVPRRAHAMRTSCASTTRNTTTVCVPPNAAATEQQQACDALCTTQLREGLPQPCSPRALSKPSGNSAGPPTSLLCPGCGGGPTRAGAPRRARAPRPPQPRQGPRPSAAQL